MVETYASNLGEYFLYYAQEYRGYRMFKSMGKVFKYQDIYRHAQSMAAYFQEDLKLRPGDRLGIILPNIPQFPIVFLAAQMSGLVTVAINPMYTKREIKHIISNSEIKAVVTIDLKAGVLSELIEELQQSPIVLVTRIGDLLPRAKAWAIQFILSCIKLQVPRTQRQFISFRKVLLRFKGKRVACVKPKRSDVAMLQYTSGTTGQAKGVMLSHDNILSNIRQLNSAYKKIGIEDGKKQLLVLPFFHIYGLSVFLNGIGHCSEGVMVSNPKDTIGLVKLLGKEKPVIMPLINTLMANLLTEPRFEKMDFSWLKATISGGMATQKEVADAWQCVTGCVVNQGYGLSETSPTISMTAFHSGDTFDAHVGQPLPETKIKLLSKSGKPVKPGQPGELYVKGPQVMRGYWKSLQETSAVLSNGWLRTGDIACFDTSGNIRIVDRVKDMIVISGFNVFPSEVEQVLVQHAEIKEAAVIGEKDDHGNEYIKAFIVANQPLSEKKIKKFCRGSLAAYKIPSEINCVEEIPKSHIGKVLKRSLKEAV